MVMSMKCATPIMKVNNKMKFSIIVPIYNVEKYLKKCLDSILKQTYNNYEVILVCDKCDDKSLDIVDKYIKKNHNFIKIYKEKTGLAKARNIGIKYVTGDYIMFLDSDDYLERDLLKVLADNLTGEDILRFQVQDIVSDKVIKHEENGFDTTDGIKAFDKIIKYHYIENSWCYVYNTKFFLKNKFKFMENCLAEDYGLTPLIIAKAKKVKSISYIGYNYVQRDNSLMNNNNYNNKIKKINDMLKQANYVKKELSKISNTERFISFINNSLICFITTLNYKDYRKYKKILKQKKCFNHLRGTNLKDKFRIFMIKNSTYLFYNYVVR